MKSKYDITGALNFLVALDMPKSHEAITTRLAHIEVLRWVLKDDEPQTGAPNEDEDNGITELDVALGYDNMHELTDETETVAPGPQEGREP